MASPSRSHIPALIFLLLIPTVNSQTQIVSVSSIKDQVPFTITCAVNLVKMPAQAANLQNIFGLQIHINTNSTPDRDLATYIAGASGGELKIQNVTAGRNWVVSSSGGNGGLNNRDTIKIEVLVKDATCTDAGTYTCNVLDLMAVTHPITNSQNVSAEAGISDLVLTPSPIHTGPTNNYSTYALNESVTITCQVNGPSNLVLKWRYEQKPTSSLGPSIVDYPVANDITTSPVEQMGTGTCPKYHYASELKITITELDVMRIYMCVVQENGIDSANISVTVDVTLPVTPSPNQGGNPDSAGVIDKGDIGLIVGVTIGCIAALVVIAVIVGVVCYRRRAKGNNYKDDTDRPVEIANQQSYPPPVTTRPPYPNKPNNDRISQAHDGNDRHDNNRNDDHSNVRKERKPYPVQNTDIDYDHQQKQASRHRNPGGPHDNAHYASSDVSKSEDESVDKLVAPAVMKKPKPNPRIPSGNPNMAEEGGQLHYAQLDLVPSSRIEGAETAGRMKINTPIEYAEISV